MNELNYYLATTSRSTKPFSARFRFQQTRCCASTCTFYFHLFRCILIDFVCCYCFIGTSLVLYNFSNNLRQFSKQLPTSFVANLYRHHQPDVQVQSYKLNTIGIDKTWRFSKTKWIRNASRWDLYLRGREKNRSCVGMTCHASKEYFVPKL